MSKRAWFATLAGLVLLAGLTSYMVAVIAVKVLM